MAILKEPSMSANTMTPPLTDTAVRERDRADAHDPDAARPRRRRRASWPPRKPSAGTPPKSSASCSKPKPPAGTPRCWPPAANAPDSPPGRPSMSGTRPSPPCPAATTSFLRTLEWVRRRENLIACGPSGTGKTLLLEALGQQAIDQGMSVSWLSMEDLGALVRRHRIDDSVNKAITRPPTWN